MNQNKTKTRLRAWLLVCLIALASCKKEDLTHIDLEWDKSVERPWLGAEVWAVPMEDWSVGSEGAQVKLRTGLWSTDGGFEEGGQAKTIFLMAGKLVGGDFKATSTFAITADQKTSFFAMEFGHKWESNDDRSVINRHKRPLGLMASLGADGKFKLADKSVDVPVEKDSYYKLEVVGQSLDEHKVKLTARCFNEKNKEIADLSTEVLVEKIVGVPSLSLWAPEKAENQVGFRIKSWKLSGKSLLNTPQNKMGPIFWNMYSLNQGVLKMNTQFFPIGENDNRDVELEVQNQDGSWETLATTTIDPISSNALFRIENWDDTKNHPYRIKYLLKNQKGSSVHHYDGTVRKDPVDKDVLVMGVANCTKGQLFPYSRTVANLKVENPDILFFSGDQLYEDTGEYHLLRAHGGSDDETIKDSYRNYLAKLAHWGWGFRDLMRDRPSIVLTDDHDVYQGNLWGESGRHIYDNLPDHNKGGYSHHPTWVNAVQRAQMAHNPDAYDPSPIHNDITVHYGDFKYGGVSFAFLEDRKFKSGPNGKVNFWKGRPDHVPGSLADFDPKSIDLPELELLGEGQLDFLNNWILDWKDVYLKCVLSQTIFANIATHHGGGQRLLADLDSNGWPQTGRNKAISLMRKAFAPQIAGDQHLPTLIQYGYNNWNDASFAFTSPAIATGYPRRWLVDNQLFVNKQYELPNTGEYKDGFGNIVSVHGVGNPDSDAGFPGLWDKTKFQDVEDAEAAYSSGYGIIDFNKKDQTYTFKAYKLKTDASNRTDNDQFLGFPKTISISDNYSNSSDSIIKLMVKGIEKPVVKVFDPSNGDLIYTRRFNENDIDLPIFDLDKAKIQVLDPERNIEREVDWSINTGQSEIEVLMD